MFETFRTYRVIIVTGPQRSGTRIAANIIAADTGYSYIDEMSLNIDSLYKLKYAVSLSRVVIQCPALCRYVHNLADADVLVVMVKRSVEDIEESQHRICWNYEDVEQIRYQNFEKPIAELKYDLWEQQKRYIPNFMELEYESLKEHRLWLDKEERQNFSSRQIDNA